MSAREAIMSLGLLAVAEWMSILSLVFGGCCTNALALELITTQNPSAGSLITFAQFLLISVVGLRKHLIFGPPRPPGFTREQTIGTLAESIISLRAADVASAVRTSRLTKKKAEREQLHYRVAIDYNGSDSDASRAACKAFADDLSERLRCEASFSGVIRSSVVLAKDGEASMSKSQWRPALSSQARSRKQLDVDDMVTERRLDDQHSPLMVTIPDDSVLIMDGHGTLRMPVPENWWHLTVSLRDPASERRPQKDEAKYIFEVTDWNSYLPPLPAIRAPWKWIPRFKELRVPLRAYLLQVVLYYLVSILNNVAFAYNIPMGAHIIFRSGGLVMNMTMGRLFAKKRYSRMQVVSVLVVTIGILLTTVASIQGKPSRRAKPFLSTTSASPDKAAPPLTSYLAGIGILTLALVLASTLGLTQDNILAKYGRGNADESMLYLHFLALPMFSFVAPDIVEQIRIANSGPMSDVSVASLLTFPAQTMIAFSAVNSSPSTPAPSAPPLPHLIYKLPSIRVPAFYVPLLLNVLTQAVCTAGVHRLTTRVSSLTVTLILAVRKALSLAISVLLLGGSRGNEYLWGGAAAVLVGTIFYTMSEKPSTPSTAQPSSVPRKEKEKIE